MKILYWALLLLSSFLYVLPFFCIQYCWWMIFTFTLPLLWVVTHNRIRFIHAYIWGLCTFTLHLINPLHALIYMAQGPKYIPLLLGIFIIMYESLFAGIFLLAGQKIIDFLNWRTQTFYCLSLWTVILYKFIYFIDTTCLFIFDNVEGYCLMHPLIPLACYPIFLTLLPIIGKQALTLMLLALPTSITFFILKQNKKSFFLLVCIILLWLLSFIPCDNKVQKPLWLKEIVALPYLFYADNNTDYLTAQARFLFKKIIQKYPCVSLIITPESSFHINTLHDKAIINRWNNESLGKNVQLMIGAFRYNKGKYYNCLHWIEDGTIKRYFDKRHILPLTERVPSLFNYTCIKNLYFKKYSPIDKSTKDRPLFSLNKTMVLVPYICSELFFNQYPDDVYSHAIILAICNDNWFNEQTARLLYCAAKCKALLWQRPIIYISFHYQMYIDAYGNETKINSYNQ